MLTISTKDKEFADILDLVNKYENIYGTKIFMVFIQY